MLREWEDRVFQRVARQYPAGYSLPDITAYWIDGLDYWQPEADGIADPQESFTEPRRRRATEIEGAFFKDMRKLAPLITEALEQTVRPKIRMLEIDWPEELSC